MINYQNLQDSITAYEQYGYQRVETPWCVTAAISNMTKPPHGTDYSIGHNEKVLVASGEQSFLYQYAKGYLPKGKFQTVTPCYRRENYDATHMKYFMKNELINTADVSEMAVMRMLDEALDFFGTKLDAAHLAVVETGVDSWDIQYRGLELGSYGIRRNDMLAWVYGTGCAEPRLSYAQNMDKAYRPTDADLQGSKNGRVYDQPFVSIDDIFAPDDETPEVSIEDYQPEWSNKHPIADTVSEMADNQQLFEQFILSQSAKGVAWTSREEWLAAFEKYHEVSTPEANDAGVYTEFNNKYSTKFGKKPFTNLCCEIPLPGPSQVCAIVPQTEEEIAAKYKDVKRSDITDLYADIHKFLADNPQYSESRVCVAHKPQQRPVDLIFGGPSSGVELMPTDYYNRRERKSIFDFIGMVEEARKAEQSVPEKVEEAQLVDDYDNDEGPFARVDASIEYMRRKQEEAQEAADKAAKVKAFHDKLDASAKRWGFIR